jgi:hypothetical protein
MKWSQWEWEREKEKDVMSDETWILNYNLFLNVLYLFARR